ncbi:MAG: hypothetical protein V1856_00220 [Candidatus Liptonbacteria bacterium]
MNESRTCQNCKQGFVIEPEDFQFYEKIKVPPPTWCPECRFVRRLMARNERNLFKRRCDLCGEDKIMFLPADCPYKVYCYQCFFSDKWDAGEHGRDYDFSGNFFEQWFELFKSVPRLGVIQQGNNVNSEYTNRASDNKNCYLIFAAANNENCLYCNSLWDSKESMDCYNLHKSERCYECIDCYQSSGLKYSQECNNCSSSSFLFNCRNCSDCFGCVNLRNKNYCIWNKQYSREEYQQKLRDIYPRTRKDGEDMWQKISELKRQCIVPAMMEYRTVNSSGNWIEESKNVKSGFNCRNVEDGKYLFGIVNGKDSMDYTYWGMGSELIYESSNIGRQCASVFFSSECWDQLLRAEYCMNCFSSSDLFGCVGLRKKQHRILNKQYSKEEYEKLVPRIIEQMKSVPYADSKGKTYSYGERIPIEFLPFAYNETIAQEYFPITKAETEARGYLWKELAQKNYEITMSPDAVPDGVGNIPDSILNEVIGCAHRGNNCNHMCISAFKITPYELEYYRQMNLSLPILCPNCRHLERLNKRVPHKLWKRKCMCNLTNNEQPTTYNNKGEHFHKENPCPNEFETSYAPNREETVYCLECYNAEVA